MVRPGMDGPGKTWRCVHRAKDIYRGTVMQLAGDAPLDAEGLGTGLFFFFLFGDRSAE